MPFAQPPAAKEFYGYGALGIRRVPRGQIGRLQVLPFPFVGRGALTPPLAGNLVFVRRLEFLTCHCEERSDAAIRISCPFCFFELPARDCHGLQSKPRNDKTGDFSRDRVRRQCPLYSHRRRRSFTDAACPSWAHRPLAGSPGPIRRAGCPHPAARPRLSFRCRSR